MAKKLEIYKCERCGNIVEVFVGGLGELVCCGIPMTIMEEKTADSSKEKHVPFVKETENGYKVRIGENVAHPMTEEHYIKWIELISGDIIIRKYLDFNGKAEAEFIIEKSDKIIVREYCNIHGHWKA